MRRREQEALRRLEAALMENEPEPAFPADGLESLDEFWQDTAGMDYDMYNTDDADVDLDDYSEEVHRGKSGNGLSVALTMVAMIALSASILLFLKILGVL